MGGIPRISVQPQWVQFLIGPPPVFPTRNGRNFGCPILRGPHEQVYVRGVDLRGVFVFAARVGYADAQIGRTRSVSYQSPTDVADPRDMKL